jgi:hypothetical protein
LTRRRIGEGGLSDENTSPGVRTGELDHTPPSDNMLRLIVTYKNVWIKEMEGHPFLYSQINNNNQ